MDIIMKDLLIYVFTSLWKACQFMYWHQYETSTNLCNDIVKYLPVYVLTSLYDYERPTDLCIDIIMKDPLIYVLTSLWKTHQYIYWHHYKRPTNLCIDIMKDPPIYVLTSLIKIHQFMCWHYERSANLCIDIIMKERSATLARKEALFVTFVWWSIIT